MINTAVFGQKVGVKEEIDFLIPSREDLSCLDTTSIGSCKKVSEQDKSEDFSENLSHALVRMKEMEDALLELAAKSRSLLDSSLR